jgi:NADPH-dependent 2,4-dienoyl-CoA reductase/sulfur reductase-like enzyme/ferredoxin
MSRQAAAIPIVPAAEAERFFANYTQVAPRAPRVLWWALRVGVLAVTLALALLLLLRPGLGLMLFWGLAIPVLPALLVVAPGLWRQVCPMALLNQLPRSFGRGLARELPEAWKRWSFAIAVGLFVGAVALRAPWLNGGGVAVGLGVFGVLALALAGGLVFKGRSGWCGTFCPLGPIQRHYGQAPLVLVRNGYCEPCVGCQKNCYDFNPRAAIFSDVHDDDPRHAGQRRLFMGLLPGLLLGYFVPAQAGVDDAWLRSGWLLGGALASAGVYSVLLAYLPLAPYRLSLAFGALAVAVFYAFAGPLIVGTLAQLAGAEPPAALVQASRATGLLLAAALAASGLYAERRWSAVNAARSAARQAGDGEAATSQRTQFGGGRSLKDRLGQASAAEVTDRETGITFQAPPDGTLLEAIERAGLKINYGCRAGVCGADPVVLCEGADQVTPPGADELATLRRLGLEGRARLACMCTVKGPVTIDRDPRNVPAPAAATGGAGAAAPPAVDKAERAGIKRVVIIGNGIAGMSAAEALRRDSASAEITVVANEPHGFYNRMGIGRLVYDRDGMSTLALVPDDWAERQRVALLTRAVAARIDRSHRRVGLAGGRWLEYDKLIVASGARASLPAPDFLQHPNAFVLRSADDAQSIREHVQRTRARRAVVVGGGVLGVEAADVLHKLGLRVTLLQRADRLMNAQLDERGAAVLTTYLEGIGIQVVTGVSVSRYDGAPDLSAAWLAHGPRVRADLFVACLGIQPNVHLAIQAGLPAKAGILVDPTMRTADPDIYAIGDCAEPPGGGARGLWPLAAAQAAVAVQAIWGEPARYEAGRALVQLKCDGIDLRSLGDVEPRPGDRVFEARPEAEAWWRLILRADELAGGVFVGPPGSSKPFVRLVQGPADAWAGTRALLAAGDLAAAVEAVG